MSKKMFLNLPVADLQRSVDFFTALGFTFDNRMTNENATCMIVDDNVYVMLLVKPFFKTFINTEISDATKTTEALIGIGLEDREQVDLLTDRAIEKGAIAIADPKDQGFMYSRNFHDLDGHIWEVFYFDVSVFNA